MASYIVVETSETTSADLAKFLHNVKGVTSISKLDRDEVNLLETYWKDKRLDEAFIFGA